MCLSPVILRPTGYSDRTTQAVPCGKCVDCLRARVNSWAFRLSEEQKISETAFFCTFTYDSEHVPVTPNGRLSLRRKDFQLFMKRLRKSYPTSDIKYYVVGEYGSDTQRPHYHAVMYNIPYRLAERSEELSAIWQHGNVDVRKNNIRTIKYTLKYLMKTTKEQRDNDPLDDREPEKPMMSKRMGLNYLTPAMVNYHVQNKEFFITEPGGSKLVLPRYYRDKLFSRSEKAVFAASVAREFENFDEKFINLETHTQWKKQKIERAERANRLSRKGL